MARINLLPWREELRKQRQTEFGYMMLGAAVAAVALVYFVISYYDGQIADQEGRNALIQAEIVKLDKQIAEIKELEKKKQELVTRIEIIQNLQLSRPLVVRLFDTLPRTLPDGVYLTELSRTGSALAMKGKTESNNRVSKFMRNIDDSTWLGSPVLEAITAEKSTGQASSQFLMKAQQILPKPAGGAETVDENVKKPKKSANPAKRAKPVKGGA